jgi:PKHD-type hydroxylase
MTTITKYKYYYFKRVLSPDFCDKVIEHGKSLVAESAQTGTKRVPKQSRGEQKLQKEIRNSTISWISDIWITKEIDYYVHEANIKANWNFDLLDNDKEDIQFTEYTEGQYYGWHTDCSTGPMRQGRWNGLIRKLSTTVSLTDPSDYDGGNLEFDFKNYKNVPEIKNKCMEILPRGSIVVFPSYTWHRITPVTRGTRYSLVQWSAGAPFK